MAQKRINKELQVSASPPSPPAPAPARSWRYQDQGGAFWAAARTSAVVCVAKRASAEIHARRPLTSLSLNACHVCYRIWARILPPTAAPAPSETTFSTGKPPSWGLPTLPTREASFSSTSTSRRIVRATPALGGGSNSPREQPAGAGDARRARHARRRLRVPSSHALSGVGLASWLASGYRMCYYHARGGVLGPYPPRVFA